MDIKLKDLLQFINTNQTICIINKTTGEKFFPNYGGMLDYIDYYVLDISADMENRLTVQIKEYI